MYWEFLYYMENVEGCEKKNFSWNINIKDKISIY